MHLFSNETDKVSALGATGTGRDIVDGIIDQGVVASMVGVRVEEGIDTDATMSNMIGASGSLTGMHALKAARSELGIEPGILIATGFTSQRVSNAANPVVAEMLGIGDRLKAITVADSPNTTKEDAFTYREDWPDAGRMYLVDPGVKVWNTDQSAVVVKPASARVAGLFVKRDKQYGGPYWSPSNQPMFGILGTARPVPYYDGESDHEANWLNERRIATIIENGQLWGNETLAMDPLWRFVNVRRTRDAIHKGIVNSFRWAIARQLGAHLAVAIIQSLNSFLDELKAIGAIIEGRAFWLRDLNSNEALQSGILRVEFDAEEAPPLQDLQFGSRRNVAHFDVLAADILETLDRRVAA